LAVAYTPNPVTKSVAVLLFLDKIVTPIEGRAGSTGQIFSRVFTTNIDELVTFIDLAGNTGST
jgi:hypothetical protein